MDTKQEVLLYMRYRCYGVDNARKRSRILQDFPNLSDRKFRKILSCFIHERYCIADSKHGAWFVTAECDRREAEAVMSAIRERKAKALDMLTGLKAFEQEVLLTRARKEDKEYLLNIVNGQMSFV